MPWTTPTGSTVLVDLSLKFGTFFGYTKEAGENLAATEVGSQSYLGTQCHGVMWATETDLPHGWPVAPPIVAGKVRIAVSEVHVKWGKEAFLEGWWLVKTLGRIFGWGRSDVGA